MASSQNPQRPPHSFQHHTSSAAPRHPFLDTTTPAINAAPIELDSTPISPVEKQYSWPTTKAGDATTIAANKDGSRPEQEEDQKRVGLLKERSLDPAVVVNVPKEPAADELAVAEEDSQASKNA